MKRKNTLILFLGIFIFSIAFSSASLTEEMEVTAMIKAQELGISITDSVLIQDVVRGYKNSEDFEVNNTGTSDLVFYTSLYGQEWIEGNCNSNPTSCIDSGLTEDYPAVFSNLKVGFGNTQDFVDGFSWQVEKPSEVGEVFSENFELILDLTELENGEDSQETAYILFDIMPA